MRTREYERLWKSADRGGRESDMSKAARTRKEEMKLEVLESEFKQRLVSALRDCAAGTWGLFGRNEAIGGPELHDEYWGNVGRELLGIAQAIRNTRIDLILPAS